MKKVLLTTIFVFACLLGMAQDQPEMADAFRKDGKIYVVVGIIVVILIGLFTFLFLLDRKLTKIESLLEEKTKDQ